MSGQVVLISKIFDIHPCPYDLQELDKKIFEEFRNDVEKFRSSWLAVHVLEAQNKYKQY